VDAQRFLAGVVEQQPGARRRGRGVGLRRSQS
jgi:hypothetical protein